MSDTTTGGTMSEQWKRITIEGPTEKCSSTLGADCWIVNGQHVRVRASDTIVDIDPPERWQVGDVVLDAEGVIFMRSGARWESPGTVTLFPDTRPERPLTLLVRDGKPAQAPVGER